MHPLCQFSCHKFSCMNRRIYRMGYAHHVDSHRTVKAKLLRNSRYFIGCQHYAEPQQHIVRECHQSKEQQGCLHKCRKADRYNLLAPLIEAVRIATGNAEHIQRTDRYLNEQNAATLDIGEKHLDYAVSKGDQGEDVEQPDAEIQGGTE